LATFPEGETFSVSGFDGSVSGICEMVLALCRSDGGDKRADVARGRLDGSLLAVPHPLLDFGDGLLDRVEIGGG
jgi:hypothetical protein